MPSVAYREALDSEGMEDQIPEAVGVGIEMGGGPAAVQK
jgi:hypothetical protein